MAKSVGIGALWISAATALVAATATIVGCPVRDAELRSTTGAGGSGGAGGSSVIGAGGGGIKECSAPEDCPPTGNECVVRTCIGGLCGTDNVDQGTATPTQTPGDCRLFVCDGTGGTTTKEQASDTLDDKNDCTIDICAGVIPTSMYKPASSLCAQGNGAKCDGKGSCVECLAPGDCASGVCNVQNACVDAMCGDGIKNGTESDKDCGGSCGATCQTAQACNGGGDCQSGVCDLADKTCKAPACDDEIKNGNETDKDCGGGLCQPCQEMGACAVGSDCLSGVCSGGACKAPACNDGVKNGFETDVDCGGPDCQLCPTVLMIAGGVMGSLLGEYHPNKPWATTNSSEKAAFTPGITIDASGTGVSTIEFSDLAPAKGGVLRFSIWNAGAGFKPFKDVAAGVTARGASVDASGITTSVVFYGDDSKHYYAAQKSGQWAPTAETVGVGGAQSFGPSLPAITTLGNDVYIAYAGSDGNLYDQARVGGAWGAAAQHDLSNLPSKIAATPAITALTAGPELLIVFNLQSSGQLYWTTRTNGTWSKPDVITSALSNDPVSVVALQGGNAVVAYRGLDMKLYVSRFTGASWTPVSSPLPPNPTLASRPALCAGIDAAAAELVYISSGVAYHSRLIAMSGSWTAAAAIGGANLTHVSIASGP